jgi:hypothetical protein
MRLSGGSGEKELIISDLDVNTQLQIFYKKNWLRRYIKRFLIKIFDQVKQCFVLERAFSDSEVSVNNYSFNIEETLNISPSLLKSKLLENFEIQSFFIDLHFNKETEIERILIDSLSEKTNDDYKEKTFFLSNKTANSLSLNFLNEYYHFSWKCKLINTKYKLVSFSLNDRNIYSKGKSLLEQYFFCSVPSIQENLLKKIIKEDMNSILINPNYNTKVTNIETLKIFSERSFLEKNVFMMINLKLLYSYLNAYCQGITCILSNKERKANGIMKENEYLLSKNQDHEEHLNILMKKLLNTQAELTTKTTNLINEKDSVKQDLKDQKTLYESKNSELLSLREISKSSEIKNQNIIKSLTAETNFLKIENKEKTESLRKENNFFRSLLLGQAIAYSSLFLRSIGQNVKIEESKATTDRKVESHGKLEKSPLDTSKDDIMRSTILISTLLSPFKILGSLIVSSLASEYLKFKNDTNR